MKSMVKSYLVLVLICITVLNTPIAANAQDYNGRWWLSLNQRQSGGFVQGFIICYYNLADASLFTESYRAYTIRLREYLQSHQESLKQPVGTTLITIARPPYSKTAKRPSLPNETPKESSRKWGANNDGDEWRGSDPWQLGYVQGFLTCYSKQTKAAYGTFSKSPEWYVNAIAEWYGTKANDPSAINLAREHEKIPEVLFRFRDKNGQ